MRYIFFLFLFLKLILSPAFAQSLYEHSYPGVGSAAGLGDLSPITNLNNPAALGLTRDANFLLVAQNPFQMDFIGASQYSPLIGTLSFSLSRFQIAKKTIFPDSLTDSSELLERATAAFGRAFGNRWTLGASLHANRMNNKDFGTANISFMVLESKDNFVSELYNKPLLFINSLRNNQKYSFSYSYHDFSFNKKNLTGFSEFGFHFRYKKNMPYIYSTIRTTGHDEKINIGLGMALNDKLSLFSTYDDLSNMTAGGAFIFGHQVFSLGYSNEAKKIIADFALRIGAAPAENAKKFWKSGVSLSRRGSYKIALKEIHKYRTYNPHDPKGLQLEKWLHVKVAAHEDKINSLLAQAQRYIEDEKYLKADLCYLEILAIDKKNKQALQGIEEIKSLVNLNVLKIAIIGKNAYKNSNYAAAERAFFAIKQVRPEHAEAKLYLHKIKEFYYNEAEKLFLRGLGYYNQKNYKMAVVSFEEALEKSQNHAESVKYLEKSRSMLAWQTRETKSILAQANRFVRKDNFKKASELYQKILELDPQNQVAKNELRILKPKLKRYISRLILQGKTAFENKDYDLAKDYFEKANALDQSREANYYLTKIIEVRRNRLDSDFNKAETAFSEKNWQKAISFYNRVLQQDETHTASRNKRKQAYQNSDFDELLKSADEKIENSNYFEAYELYTALQERDSNNTYIQAQVDTCRLYLHEEVELFFNSGISFFAGENYENAIKEWDAALRIDPNHAKSKEYKKKAEQRLKALNRL
ncbi:MAG: hypothetical protein DWQ05_12445 [Calditrichaeota bacterium]|nr:MAG: hypothetical protein DWQ05_12445 [Calditrichota bacterium]